MFPRPLEAVPSRRFLQSDVLLKKSAIERALTGKLGCEVENKGHRVFLFSVDGEVVAKTHTSHGGDEDLRDPLIAKMAEQLGVSKRFFAEVVQCTKSRAEFEAERRSP